MYGMPQFSPNELDDLADRLWLQQSEAFQLEITEQSQRMHSQVGGYSIDVLQLAVEQAGARLVPVFPLNESLPMGASTEEKMATVLHHLTSRKSHPIKLLLHHRNIQHYTVLIIQENGIVTHFDSLKLHPVSLSPSAFIGMVYPAVASAPYNHRRQTWLFCLIYPNIVTIQHDHPYCSQNAQTCMFQDSTFQTDLDPDQVCYRK
jgi:hypothetical protein